MAIEKFQEIAKREKLAGANIVICNENGILDKDSYGYQDLENKEPSTEDTIYRIASISKTIGCIGLMQLVEKGLVDLNEDISTYLGYKVRNPKYPDDVITVKMITMQTSSIQDGYDDENPAYDDIIKGYNGLNGTYINCSPKTILTDTSSEYYTQYTFGDYKPGTRFCYSNFGCGLMACIIEKASGELYVDYMENHIFKPLGLNASFKSSRLNNKENIAQMYAYYKGNIKKFDKSSFINSQLPIFPLGENYRGPAGGLFINMKDLSVLLRMFLNYGKVNGVEILKRETVERMIQEEWCGLPKNDEYRAKGIQMRIIEPVPHFALRGHTGGAYGVRSYFFFSLKYKIGACFITNGILNDDSKSCDRLFDETMEMWINKYAKYRPSKIIIKEKEIILEERTIKQEKLFINKNNPYILGKTLADMLSTLAIYDEDKMTYTFNVDNKQIIIDDMIIINDEFYIPFTKTLEKLNIPFTKENGNYIINY